MRTFRQIRPVWAVEEWEGFGGRCRSVRDRIDALIRMFPETAGLTPGHINDAVRVHDALVKAMVSAESLFVEQHPECNHRAIVTIHGTDSTAWLPCRGRVKKGAPSLSREEWAEIGRNVKAIHAAVGSLLMEIQATRGATKAKHVARFSAALKAIGHLKCRLDTLVYRQHPGWTDFIRVFYGPTEPKTDG